MINLLLYFQIHQPYRLRHFRLRDVGRGFDYFEDNLNRELFLRIAERCYSPTFTLLDELLSQYKDFKVSFSVSGTWLSQCEDYHPELLAKLKRVMAHENVEILCETSHHSLASLSDTDEFCEQVSLHAQRLLRLFKKPGNCFRNTELIYSDEIGALVDRMGFKACLCEGWEHLLTNDFNPHRIFKHPENSLLLLPRAYRRSDDISFRFSNTHWKGWPLTPEKYLGYFKEAILTKPNFFGLYMDIETFGEHQPASSGIFNFLSSFIKMCMDDKEVRFLSPQDILEGKMTEKYETLSIKRPLSWADEERDVSAWLQNDFQHESLQKVYEIKSNMLMEKAECLEIWRRLQTSDHFYYMSQKCAADGEVHGYFSHCLSPLDAYLEFNNILEDFIKYRILKGTINNY